ncbi:sugar ABC transporter substrate-binding protein [Paraburkholderia lacunae]|uniref:Sugar ABC transporter substrate-binding protein n=1 Tax=Paraburkholderia lacunae TaxID=2211104 RepID=A0A370N5E6_9BURK|nr:sugar ABC transporter substrate-binding protein [Paraburkholderia lacunae]RDK00841.1 sugar ABC transporter substrate-binding protein [Paraburkholderia lacunae]
MKCSIRKVLGLTAAVLSLGLCTGVGAETVAHFDFITHAPDSDAWWNTVKNGIKQADDDFNVQTDYRNPPNGDLADMVQLVNQAAARNYDGVVTTIADFDLLKGSVSRLKAKNIPFITANTGTEKQSAELGALMHVGQPEYLAGKEAGLRAKADGISTFLCVNHYATNPLSFERCRGFAEAIGADMKASVLDVGTDPTGIEGKVSAFLRTHPNTQAVLTLGPTSADPTIRAVTRMGLAGKIWFATFDIDADVAKAIKDGTIKFCTDQQPYLQGYIPIAMLAIMHRTHNTDVLQARSELEKDPRFIKRLQDYGLKPVYEGRNISSGPGFITPQNIEQVSALAGRYR